jgi:hypothetical protein
MLPLPLPLLHHAVDESGALSILQWVLSSRPEPAAAEQQLRAAWKMVSSGCCVLNSMLLVAWLAPP